MAKPCEDCGSEWFHERREIKPAGGPSEIPQLKTTPREVRYRLVCADCGLGYDEEKTIPKKGRKNGRQKGKTGA